MLEVTGSNPVAPTDCKACRKLDLQLARHDGSAAHGLKLQRSQHGSTVHAPLLGDSSCRDPIPHPPWKHDSGQARVTIDGKDRDLGKYGSPESKALDQELVRRHLADCLRDKVTRGAALSPPHHDQRGGRQIPGPR